MPFGSCRSMPLVSLPAAAAAGAAGRCRDGEDGGLPESTSLAGLVQAALSPESLSTLSASKGTTSSDADLHGIQQNREVKKWAMRPITDFRGRFFFFRVRRRFLGNILNESE